MSSLMLLPVKYQKRGQATETEKEEHENTGGARACTWEGSGHHASPKSSLTLSLPVNVSRSSIWPAG
jgi:hypothetical protein